MSENELPDGVESCDVCGRYMTFDRERAPMPAGGRSGRAGTPEEPLPAVAEYSGVRCQLCGHDALAGRLMDMGTIVAHGECTVCDTRFWDAPMFNPGGPVGAHSAGAVHGATHCTCGRPGCGTTD